MAEESSAAPTIERGTYEIIRDRLLGHGSELEARATALNARRLELFGGIETEVIGNERIRTEHNCIPRDIVAVGDRLLFGYHVFIGLKRETAVADVFSLLRFERTDDGLTFEPIASSADGDFLSDPKFVEEFHELHRYYKHTRLLQLRRVGAKLLAIFQIGEQRADIKVFRWAVDPDGVCTYIDNRGERDHVFPAQHDFEWTQTTRAEHVSGRHPHVSIEDEVFVDTVGGDLTVKIEDNTQDGLGVYREPVANADQALDDAEVHYVRLGTVILIKVLPYRENVWRYLVFNTRTHKVDRIDAIGQSCVQLPEDHGLIFPGGYYLASGETKSFDGNTDDMELMTQVRSPNGEDVLYVFHRRSDGASILLPYNMIRKEVQNPHRVHGYSLFRDGTMVVFRATSDEPTRVHPMRVWQTPFMSAEAVARRTTTGSFLENVGNPELVRGISDALGIRRMIDEQEPTRQKYEDLVAAATRVIDAYYWLEHEEVDLLDTLREARATAEQIIDEFEKVEALRADANKAVRQTDTTLGALLSSIRPDTWTSIDQYVEGLSGLRRQRGHLITMRDMRYVDRARLDELEEKVVERFDRLSGAAVDFLLDDRALEPYRLQIDAVEEKIATVAKVADATPLGERLEGIGEGLDLLTEIVGALEIDDATVRTRILEGIAELLGSINRVRALLTNRRKELLHREGVAEFGAQFALFSQTVTSALSLSDTPEKCDAQLSRLMVSLEELESRFSEFDEFLEQLTTKREEVFEALSARKQQLMDQRQRRAQSVMQAGERIVQGVVRRSSSFTTADDLNAFFASDPMVAKLRDLSGRLRELGDSVRADELESRVKSAREDAARSLRDRQDIFEEGAAIIKLGQHRFSVNTQRFELTMVPRDERMAFYLTGTDFYEAVEDAEFQPTQIYWDQELVSETKQVYRGEYLAFTLLEDAELGLNGLSLRSLQDATRTDEGLLGLIRERSQERYDEGYARGVHDHDAAAILERALALYGTADLLRFAPAPRAYATLFWAELDSDDRRQVWQRQALNLDRLRDSFAHSAVIAEFADELAAAIADFLALHGIELSKPDARMAGRYLFEELAREPQRFVLSADAEALRTGFTGHLETEGEARQLADDLAAFAGDLNRRWTLARAWVDAYLARLPDERRQGLEHASEETVVAVLTDGQLARETSNARVAVEIEGLLGQHPRLGHGKMQLRLDEFLARVSRFRHDRVPAYRRYQELRHALLVRERRRLRLDEFRPKVMSAFVRNKLINEVYLPLIGDNLAKQMGTVGADKRTDLMGLLLLISPPGYGKTTLMGYIANRLGLVFVKVNGPALGHGVTSLDPTEAPNATARQEVNKINFALEMGNNVLLYLDDIQHTNPELLQKFISMCDAQRRMEGVWKGETRTYDLKGKKVCICMAGNPYTESGERFRIPDMLANRADIYNLGDILEGKERLFELSYIENALTSNKILAPLTTREHEDIYKLVRMARGEEIQADQLAHDYSSVELGEILSVLEKLLVVQRILLAINRQYIRSASQDDAYRTEPPFKLQGSYRNMNKLAEKVIPAMNEDELQTLIANHYLGEAQTLTKGAEENLLKLAELRGVMSAEQSERWETIKKAYVRVQAMGGGDDDPVARLGGQIGLVARSIDEIVSAIARADGRAGTKQPDLSPLLAKLDETLTAIGSAPRARPTAGSSASRFLLEKQAELIDAILIPLLRSMAHKLKGSKDLKDSRLKRLLPKLEYIDTIGDLLGELDDIDDQTRRSIEVEDPKSPVVDPPNAKPRAKKRAAKRKSKGSVPPVADHDGEPS